jgi:hypothetical protein
MFSLFCSFRYWLADVSHYYNSSFPFNIGGKMFCTKGSIDFDEAQETLHGSLMVVARGFTALA